jgi:hypothetical protein
VRVDSIAREAALPGPWALDRRRFERRGFSERLKFYTLSAARSGLRVLLWFSNLAEPLRPKRACKALSLESRSIICKTGSSTVNRAKVLRSNSDPIRRRRTASPDSSKVYREVKCHSSTNSDTIKVSHVRACSVSNSGYSNIRSDRGLFSVFEASPCVDCVLSG